MYSDFSRYLVTVASILLVLGLYHQVYKMFKTKSASDFTYSILIALFFAEIAWLNYGLLLNEWPIIVMVALELPASILALYGRYKFSSTKKLNES